MRGVFVVLLSILITMEIFSQNKSTDRQPVVAGSFYSANKDSLTKDLAKYFADCRKSPPGWQVRAIICPHAGYVYSGEIAASAFCATPGNAKYRNIFIIGSSHVMSFEGASVYDQGDFITPLGRAVVNREIAGKLKNENKVFDFPVDAHRQEHSLEVQVPFIQYYYTSKPMIVPVIIGHTTNTAVLKKIANALRPWFTPENLFVISSDFSHYPAYKDAVETDNVTAANIISGNPQTFLTGLSNNESKGVPGLLTSMCGWTSGLVLMELAEGNKSLEFKKIDYSNSGDTPYGDKTRVVGYNSIALIEKTSSTDSQPKSADSFSLTGEEKDQLFKIARNSIETMLYQNKRVNIDEKMFTAALNKQMGAFVTLKIDNMLRGCIGRFVSSDPLCEVVNVSALSSAFEDPRFPPLSKEEYKKTDIEITVLGPMKKINSIKEIILGKHGIYIKKDYRSGTMLPQVATENGWTLEQFLGYTSRDKAGLGWEGWKDAEIYIYEGVVLEENRK